jgi:hypothetical protein
MSVNLSHFLLGEDSFMRMRSNGELYAIDMDYKDYRIWNLECIAALTDEEHNWMVELCRRISDKKIRLMDEESSIVFTATNIYFDMAKNLVITNPR